MGLWGRVEFSEDALSDPQAFLLHAGQRGTRHVFGATHSGEAALLQDEVVVGRRVHGVKDVCVVWNLQLCGGNVRKSVRYKLKGSCIIRAQQAKKGKITKINNT